MEAQPMHRSPLRCLALIAALGLAACAAYQAQHARRPGAAGSEPGAPAQKPDHEFRELPTDEQLTRVRGEVEDARWNRGSEGKYFCCVEPPCSECLLRRGACHCRQRVREKHPACGECTGAWVEGRGMVEGVSPEEMLERKRQELVEGHHHHPH